MGELIMHLLVHIETIGRRAGFAHVAHLGDHRAFNGGIDVGIVENEKRRIAAELHGGLDHLIGGFMQELAADFRGAGERYDAHAWIVQHGCHHLA